jgi:CBS domain-containing protein
MGEIMTPASELKTVDSKQTAASVLEQMDELGIGHLPVIGDGIILGLVVRDDLSRLSKTRAELKI